MGKNKRKKRKNAAARRARAAATRVTPVTPKQMEQESVVPTPDPVTLTQEPTQDDFIPDDCPDNVVSATADVVEDIEPQSSNWCIWLWVAIFAVSLISLILLIHLCLI